MRFDALVQERASRQRTHGGKTHRFFLQRDKPPLLADNPAVGFAQIGIGASGEKEQAGNAVPSFLPGCSPARRPRVWGRPPAGTLHIPRWPGYHTPADSLPLPDLPEPGQVSVRCAEAPAEREPSQRRRPIIGNQKPLPQGQKRLPSRLSLRQTPSAPASRRGPCVPSP